MSTNPLRSVGSPMRCQLERSLQSLSGAGKRIEVCGGDPIQYDHPAYMYTHIYIHIYRLGSRWKNNNMVLTLSDTLVSSSFWHFSTLFDTFSTLCDTFLVTLCQNWSTCQSVSERVRDLIDPPSGVSERVSQWPLELQPFWRSFSKSFVCGVIFWWHLSHSSLFGAA